jgi:hypothetical protein
MFGAEAFADGQAFDANPFTEAAPLSQKHWARGWCEAQRQSGEHASDCALHNLPALEPLPCNCGASGYRVVESFDRSVASLQVDDGQLVVHLEGEPEGYAPVTNHEADALALTQPNQFLSSIMERGGTWHDGGENPAPDWFCDIYVPHGATIHGESHELQGQPSNAYEWKGWEVAYVKTKPMTPITNPDADAIARGDAYYSPQAQREREREESVFNRFNPFRVKADA